MSRVVATLKEGLAAWRTRPLNDVDAIYLYLDGFALRVRSAGKVVSVPVLGVVGVLPDGRKQLLALDLCAGESFAGWKGCVDNLATRGLRSPLLCIIDSRTLIGLPWNPSKPAAMIFCRSSIMTDAVTAMTGMAPVVGSARSWRSASIPLMPGS